ncbi:MAG: hypothetical protein JEZ00_05280 [Anaerolineaceae bacterium]|nr:hypothetical protein [Anaerolineaceae bacterium]
MTALGIHLTLMIGPTVAVPAPLPYLEALQSVRVTHSDTGRSGFQLTFQAGRPGPSSLMDYPLLSLPLLKVFNRVILIVTINAIPGVLLDGIITDQQLSPGNQPGTGTITVTGEDVSVMMDMEEKNVEHPAQPELVIANKIIATYAQYGLIPIVLPPLAMDVPLPIERIPAQRDTDLGYLNEMAGRHGYVFYVVPGPAPFTNTAYWGPPVRLGIPQSALSVNLGPNTNVNTINFQNNALAPAMVSGQVQDRQTNQTVPVQTVVSTRPPLSSQPAVLVNQPNVRTTQFQGNGLNIAQSYGRAQAQTDASTDDTLTVTGELDAVRYGGMLQARSLVGLRGVGFTFDGFYYVKSVTHNITRGDYKQSFTLKREGTGAISPVVVP